MKKIVFISILHILLFCNKSFSQGYLITSPNLKFNGTQLLISYDLITKNPADKFYVWIEIERKNGTLLLTKALSGDIGENLSPGSNHTIIWEPAKDSIFLNEEILVEIKAEKYNKSFKKGSAILKSTLLPGLGQTKISNGKPWWIIGLASYGSITGGVIIRNNYISTYNSYKAEVDPTNRTILLNQAQQQLNLSDALIVTGSAVWAVNVLLVALKPNKYKPLEHISLSMNQLKGPYNNTTLLSFKLNF